MTRLTLVLTWLISLWFGLLGAWCFGGYYGAISAANAALLYLLVVHETDPKER